MLPQDRDIEEREKQDFWEEVKFLRRLQSLGGHANIVRFVGYVDAEEMMLLLEFASGGSLLQHLRKHKQDRARPLPEDQAVAFALQVAAGMRHIAGHSMVHRDLAARNVLLSDTLVCKITDFGLARDVQGGNGQYQANVGYKQSNPTGPSLGSAPCLCLPINGRACAWTNEGGEARARGRPVCPVWRCPRCYCRRGCCVVSIVVVVVAVPCAVFIVAAPVPLSHSYPPPRCFPNPQLRAAYKWTSLEALTQSVYTIEGDAWSYGVLLSEICSLGNNPYLQYVTYTVDRAEMFPKRGSCLCLCLWLFCLCHTHPRTAWV